MDKGHIDELLQGFPNSSNLGELAKQILSSPRLETTRPRTKKLISPTEFLEEKKDVRTFKFCRNKFRTP